MLELTLSTAQVIPLATFCLLVAIMGLLGNGLVFYSSIRYNAIDLDRISIVLVRNLAVADMLYTLLAVIPPATTYFARRYVLGDVYCYICAHFGFITGSANSLTILTITAYRLRTIVFPLDVVSRRSIHVAITFIWIFSMAAPAISLGYKSDFVFVPNSARCLSTIYFNQDAAPLFRAVLIMQVVLPLVLITVFNLVLLLVAYRQKVKHNPNTSVNVKGLITIFFLSGLFICSLTPFVIFTILKGKGIQVSPAMDLVAFHFLYLNVCGNPILYTITNRRFGNYVKDLAKRIILCGSRIGTGRSASNSAGVTPVTGPRRQPLSPPNQQNPTSSGNLPAADTTATSVMDQAITFKNPVTQESKL